MFRLGCRYGPPTRTEYRLTVENLSSRVSWQVWHHNHLISLSFHERLKTSLQACERTIESNGPGFGRTPVHYLILSMFALWCYYVDVADRHSRSANESFWTNEWRGEERILLDADHLNTFDSNSNLKCSNFQISIVYYYYN